MLQSTSLLRGKTRLWLSVYLSPRCFNPLPSCEGRQEPRQRPRNSLKCFNPLPSCEGRPGCPHGFGQSGCFNPLPSCEGRRTLIRHGRQILMLQSTSLLRGKTSAMPVQYSPQDASSHFPLAREDGIWLCIWHSHCASIHFPLAREDLGA